MRFCTFLSALRHQACIVFWSRHFVTGSRKVHIAFLSAYMGHCAAKCCKKEEIIFWALVSVKYICVMHHISIYSWHCNGHIIPAFVVHHICALNLHKSLHFHTSVFSMLFCSDNCIHSIFIVCTSCSLMHDPCIFLCKKRGGDKKKTTKENRKVIPLS